MHLKMQNRVLRAESGRIRTSAGSAEIEDKNTKNIIQWEPESSVKDQETGLTSF